MQKLFIIIFLSLWGFAILEAQELQGDRWVDNNLSIQVVDDRIRQSGIFTFCVIDTSQALCVENLSTGVEVLVHDASGKEIWKGLGSGRLKQLSLGKPFPDASYIIIKAFKPFVTNKSSGNRIYQDKRIEIKYIIK